MIVTRFTDCVGESNLPIEKYASNINEISEYVHEIIAPEFEKYGIEVTKFLIENVSMPDEIKKEIFDFSRLNTIDLDKLSKLKAAKAIEKAAENESGAAGAGMGMGMGFAMANQMGQSSSAPSQPSSPPQKSSPPPLPKSSSFYVAVNGQQTGPFDISTLKQMASQNKINKGSLVWKEGMAAWKAASEVAELNTVFGSIPPPIPQ